MTVRLDALIPKPGFGPFSIDLTNWKLEGISVRDILTPFTVGEPSSSTRGGKDHTLFPLALQERQVGLGVGNWKALLQEDHQGDEDLLKVTILHAATLAKARTAWARWIVRNEGQHLWLRVPPGSGFVWKIELGLGAILIEAPAA